jgi:hypothetical protein
VRDKREMDTERGLTSEGGYRGGDIRHRENAGRDNKGGIRTGVIISGRTIVEVIIEGLGIIENGL